MSFANGIWNLYMTKRQILNKERDITESGEEWHYDYFCGCMNCQISQNKIHPLELSGAGTYSEFCRSYIETVDKYKNDIGTEIVLCGIYKKIIYCKES